MTSSIPAAQREVLAALADAILVVDAEGTIVYANAAAETFTGRTASKLDGHPIEELLPGDRRGIHRQTRIAYQRHPTIRSMGRNLDIRLLRANGETMAVDVSLSPLQVGRAQLVVAAVRDISERRRVEDELRESREGFERLIDGVHEYAILMLDPQGRIVTWNRGAERIEGYAAEEIVGRHITVLYTPADIAAGRPQKNLELALQAGRLDVEGWRVRKDGSRYWASTVIAPVLDETGKLRGFSKVTRNMTDRRRTQARVEAALALSEATLRDPPARTLLLLLARGARNLVDARTVMVATPSTVRDGLQIDIAVGHDAARLRGGRVESPEQTRGVTSNPMSIEVTRESWHRYLPDLPRELPQQGLLVPVMARGELLALVTLLGGSGRSPYEEADRVALGLLAAQAAIAIEYGRGRVAMSQLAIVEDRERIARELHDGIIQAIFGVGLNLQASAAMTSDVAVAGRLEDAVGRLDDVVRDLRNYVFGLRPSMLADLHLDRAITRLVRDVEASSGIVFSLAVDPEAATEAARHGSDMLAIVNEVLSNLRRHSHARRASILLKAGVDALILEVADDGVGFVADSGGQGGGQGLRNLRERIGRIGGTLELRSTPGAGTTVRIILPR